MIETDRLILARPSLDDFEDSFAMGRDEAVARYIGGQAATREDVWRKLLQRIGHWTAFGYGTFTLRTRDANAFVGEVGLAYFSRELGTAFDPFPEAAWVLSRPQHGKGYATEALLGAHSWMARHHAMKRSVCIVHPQNAASLRVAARLGYVPFGTAPYRDATPLMLERSPPCPERPPEPRHRPAPDERRKRARGSEAPAFDPSASLGTGASRFQDRTYNLGR